MSDDIPRSAHGNRPPQRRSNSAPSWWPGLERTDLPDEAPASGSEGVSPGTHAPGVTDTKRAAGPSGKARRTSTLIYLVVAAAAIFLILVGVGASSTHSVVAALLVIAVPLGLAALVGSAVVRRSDL